MTVTSVPSPMPVRSAGAALFLLGLALSGPPGPKTLAFMLDDHGMGGLVIAFEDVESPDAVLHIVDVMSLAGERVAAVASLVVASVRPGGGIVPGDLDRWLEASTLCAERGLQLTEWFVIGDMGPMCPRDLLGEPPRWPQ
jgi:hypothetical protein